MNGSVLDWEWGVWVQGGWEAPTGGRGGGFKNRGCGRGVTAFQLMVTHSHSLNIAAQTSNLGFSGTKVGFFNLSNTQKRSRRSPTWFAVILKQLPLLDFWLYESHVLLVWMLAQAEVHFSRLPFPFSPSDKGTFCLRVPARVLACIYLCVWVGRTSAATWRQSSIPLSDSARSSYALRSHIYTKLLTRRNFWLTCKSVHR